MSRFTMQSDRYRIAYGFDNIPGGGYFFQVYDKFKTNDEDDGLIVNEGYTEGLSWVDMKALMAYRHWYGIVDTDNIRSHMLAINANMPF